MSNELQRRGILCIVSGPSGSGKTTLCRAMSAADPGCAYAVSCTTRKPRAGEVDGRDYHFLSREDFEARTTRGELLEWAEVHGNLYGTAMIELMRAREQGVDLLLDLDVNGAAQVRQKLPEAVTVFILPPSYPVLEQRLRGRGQDDEATIQRRLSAAGREMGAFWHYDYAIVNDDLDACVRELKSIIRAARCRVPVVAERAREIEKTFQTREETRTV